MGCEGLHSEPKCSERERSEAEDRSPQSYAIYHMPHLPLLMSHSQSRTKDSAYKNSASSTFIPINYLSSKREKPPNGEKFMSPLLRTHQRHRCQALLLGKRLRYQRLLQGQLMAFHALSSYLLPAFGNNEQACSPHRHRKQVCPLKA